MPKEQSVCTNCGFIGLPVQVKKGSGWVEIALYILFFFPGLVYSVWRRAKKEVVCPQCKKSAMVPADSPVGKKLLKEHLSKL